MKRLIFLANALAIAGLVLPRPAIGQGPFVGAGFQVIVTIDGVSQTRTPAPPPNQNTIAFNVTVGDVNVRGHAFQCLAGVPNCILGVPAVTAKVGFYKPLGSAANDPALSVTYLNEDAAAPVSNITVTVQSEAFGLATTKASREVLTLAGKFQHIAAASNPTITSKASMTLDSYVLAGGAAQLTGELPRPNPPVPPGSKEPPDKIPATTGKTSVVFQYPPLGTAVPIGVTQIAEVATVNLGGQDRVVLPGSSQFIEYAVDRIITVDTTADAQDNNPGAGCPEPCTLRQAVIEANIPPAGVNTTAILFNIPGSGVPEIEIDHDASFNSGLIDVGSNIIVDGASQPGGLVAINGKNAAPEQAGGGPPMAGLGLASHGSMAVGLDIYSFPAHGILIQSSGDTVNGNDVESNIIGTDPTQTLALPNGGDGIHINSASSNTISTNVIQTNVGAGIAVDGLAATGNYLHENIESGNASGILLSNGGNNLQPAPTITAATFDGSNVTVTGTIHSTANSLVTVDVFANVACSASTEAENFLGSTAVMTDPSGVATFSDAFPEILTGGESSTATVTDPAGNTSQLSACFTITTSSTKAPIANAGSDQTVIVGTLVTLNGTGSSDPNTPPLPLTYQWTQASGPAVTLNGANTASPTFTPTTAGTYVFSLIVNNGVSSSTASTVTITVTPSSVTEQLQSLIAQVQALDVPDNVKTPLLVHLNNASKFISRSQNKQAIQSLNVFIHLVQINERRGISPEEAAALIDAANQLIASL